MNGPPHFRFTRDFLLYRPRPEGVLPIQLADWDRLKRSIARIPTSRRLLDVLSSTCLGVFASAVLALVAVLSSSGVPAWAVPTTYSILVVSLCLGIVFEILSRRDRAVTALAVSDFLQEMALLEASFDNPQQSSFVSTPPRRVDLDNFVLSIKRDLSEHDIRVVDEHRMFTGAHQLRGNRGEVINVYHTGTVLVQGRNTMTVGAVLEKYNPVVQA